MLQKYCVYMVIFQIEKKEMQQKLTECCISLLHISINKYLLTHKKYRRITVIPIDQRIVYKAVILVKQIIVLAAVVM